MKFRLVERGGIFLGHAQAPTDISYFLFPSDDALLASPGQRQISLSCWSERTFLLKYSLWWVRLDKALDQM